MRKAILISVMSLVVPMAFAQEEVEEQDSNAAPVEASAPAEAAAPVEEAEKEEVVEPPKELKPAKRVAKKKMKLARRVHGAAYLFYSTADEIEFDEISATSGGSSGAGDLTFKTEAGLGVGVEAFDSAPHSWGWSAGLSYEPKRKLKSFNGSINGSGFSAVYTSPQPTFELWAVYGNATYQWEQFYVLFGLNFSSPILHKSPGATGSIKVTGTLGAQLGVGVRLAEQFGIEFTSRAIGIDMRGDDGTTFIDYGTGYFTGAQLGVRFEF